jgi:hypothetical protein
MVHGQLSLLAVLALLFFAGSDFFNSVGGAQEHAKPAGVVDTVDQGRSLGGRVHVSYCTS